MLEPVVLPTERDRPGVGADQAAVRDGHPVGVAAEIGQHGLWVAEGRFGVDHPFGSAQGRELCREGVTFGQPGQIAEEDQITRTMQRHQPLQKQTSEQSGQDPDRQEVTWTERDPSRAIRR